MLALAFARQSARHWLSWALLFGLRNTIFPTIFRFHLATDYLKSLVSFHDWRQLGWVRHDFDDSLVWSVREQDLFRYRVRNLEDLGGAYEGHFMVIHKSNKLILCLLVRSLSLRIETFSHKLFYLNLIRKCIPLNNWGCGNNFDPIADTDISVLDLALNSI